MRRNRRLQWILCTWILFIGLAGLIGTKGTIYVSAASATSDFVIEDGVLKGYNGTSVVVTVPDGVTTIKAGFQAKASIERIILPDSVESIQNDAFYKCTGLTEVRFSKNLIMIGARAFRGCTNLQSVDLSKTSLTSLSEGTFYGCTNLTDVSLPDTIVTIGTDAFRECKHLGRINFPKQLQTILPFAFASCQSLNSVTLPDSVTYLGKMAFDDCIGMRELHLPAGMTCIQEAIVDGDYMLKTMTIPDTIEMIQADGIETSNHYISMGGVHSAGALKDIYIPESVTFIDGRDALSQVETIRGIAGSYAQSYAETYGITFEPVSYNATVTFDASGGNVAQDTKDVILGETYGALPTPTLKGYTFTGWYADENFSKAVYSTSTVKKSAITFYARWEKTTAEENTYQGDSDDFVISQGELTAYNGTQTRVVVPDGVTKIGAAFRDNENIVSVVLPDSVTEFYGTGSYGAFSGCTNLHEINIPKGVTTIAPGMFSGCSNLEHIVLPEGVTTIGKLAFNKATSLTSIVLPDSLTTIEDKAFLYCSNLREITLPESIEKIGASAFYECNVLRSLSVPAHVGTVNTDLTKRAYGLEQLQFVNGLTSIGASVLASNARIDTVYIPESVTRIDEDFLKDSKAATITIEGFKDSAAYDFYEGLQNNTQYNSQFSKISFKVLKYDATIHFVTGMEGNTLNDQQAVVGKGYGTLPVLEQEDNTFLGWKLTKDSKKLVRSTDLVESEEVTLYASWSKDTTGGDQEEPEEPDGRPTRLPSDNTSEEPADAEYTEIATAEELNAIRDNLNGNYRLIADIDLSQVTATGGTYDVDGLGWCPIGADKDALADGFTGIFDGNGHTISGLTITGEVPYKDVGLFARVEGGTIRNLKLANCKIEGGRSAVRCGCLAGYVSENEETGKQALIENCKITSGEIKFLTAKDVISENIAVGGITGYMGKGVIRNCSSKADVTYFSNEQEFPTAACSRFLGGITGYLQGGTVTRCNNTGVVSCFRDYYGQWSDAEEGDVVAAALTGKHVYAITGGICGVGADGGRITECYNTGQVDAYMVNDYHLMSVNCTSYSNTMSGGICGALYLSTEILNCYNTGRIQSYSDRKYTLIDNTASTTDMFNSILSMLDSITTVTPPQNAIAYTAGIVGYSTNKTSGPVKYCYNIGSLAGSTGSVYAIANGSVPVAYCRFLDMTLKDKDGTESALYGNNDNKNSLSGAKALTKDEMMDKDNYRSFDFANVWFLAEEGMNAPQLYQNINATIRSAEFVDVAGKELKTEYAYGEPLDLSAIQLSVQLSGYEDEVLLDIPDNIDCGYDAYTSGKQTISITMFGATKEFEVTVKEAEYEVVVNNGEGSGFYHMDEKVTIRAAEPEEGMRFAKWNVVRGKASCITDLTQSELTFQMPKKTMELTAVYEKIPTRSVTVYNGTGSGEYLEGSTVTIKANTPKEGMYFTGWRIQGTDHQDLIADPSLDEVTFIMPASNVMITAQYAYKSTDPVDPVEPTEPTDPTQPGDNTQPGGNTQPGDNTQPGGNTQPGDNTQPGSNTQPGKTDTVPDTAQDNIDAQNPASDSSTGQGVSPAKVGTVLYSTKYKCKVKVTSADKDNPTVSYVTFSNKKAKKVTIPKQITIDHVTYRVTAIGKNVFRNCKKLKTICFESCDIRSIGNGAFKGIHTKAGFTLKGSKKAKQACKKLLKNKKVGYVKTWKIK